MVKLQVILFYMQNSKDNIETTRQETYDIMRGEGSVFSKISKLLNVKANSIRNGESSRLEEAAAIWEQKVGTTGGNGIDHTQALSLEKVSGKVAEVQSNMFQQFSELMTKLDLFLSNKTHTKADYMPILQAYAPTIGQLIKGIQNRRIQKGNKPREQVIYPIEEGPEL